MPRSRQQSRSWLAEFRFFRKTSRESTPAGSPRAVTECASVRPGHRDGSREGMVTETGAGVTTDAVVTRPEKAKAAFRRPSNPVTSVGLVEALPACPLTLRRDGRRRGTRVPYARLWRFPSRSREHTSTRWYLHCRYCSNLSRPDHLLSAVHPSVYRPRRTTATLERNANFARRGQASMTTIPSPRTRAGNVSTSM